MVVGFGPTSSRFDSAEVLDESTSFLNVEPHEVFVVGHALERGCVAADGEDDVVGGLCIVDVKRNDVFPSNRFDKLQGGRENIFPLDVRSLFLFDLGRYHHSKGIDGFPAGRQRSQHTQRFVCRGVHGDRFKHFLDVARKKIPQLVGDSMHGSGKESVSPDVHARRRNIYSHGAILATHGE
ncbi:hypothetical protein HMPREF0972_02482 [Actinomyces sp. oral taxon 848 str. F0332]|nr:hypothetical protein HMPREF0972_02482 [Actinomyces sp. oral taxon 848 str. F0332]